MLFGTENSVQLDRFRAVPLAEDTLLCKAKQQSSRWSSANPEANVADGFGAERTFSFRRISGAWRLFELVVHCRIAHRVDDLLNPCTPLRLLRVMS